MFLTTLTSVGLCDVTAALVLIHTQNTHFALYMVCVPSLRAMSTNTTATLKPKSESTVCPKSQCIASLLLGERDGLSMRSKDCLYFATVISQHVSISRSLDCLGLFFIFLKKKCCLMTHILFLNYSHNLDSRLGQNCQ